MDFESGITALLSALNIYGVETVFGWIVPEISVPTDKEGQVSLVLDDMVLKATLTTAVLEVLDNILSLPATIQNDYLRNLYETKNKIQRLARTRFQSKAERGISNAR